MRMRSVFQAVQSPVLNQALLCIPVAVHTMGWLSGQWAKRQGVCVCVCGSSEGYDFGRHAKASSVEGCAEVSLPEGQKLLVQPVTYLYIHTPSPTPPPDRLSEPIHKTESKPPPSLSLVCPIPITHFSLSVSHYLVCLSPWKQLTAVWFGFSGWFGFHFGVV